MPKYQQGFGRSILSKLSKGVRHVAVGNRKFSSDRCHNFHQFLCFYIVNIFGNDWIKSQKNLDNPHPVFKWILDFENFEKSHSKPTLVRAKDSEIPTIAALLRLAYGLYLIEHNCRFIPELVDRLKDENAFEATISEVMTYGCFAVCNCRLEPAILTSTAAPEFVAVFPSGNRYSVEVKTKSGWNHKPALENDDFQIELRQWLRDAIYRAAKKNLDNPIYWFELNMPFANSELVDCIVVPIIVEAIKEANTIKIRGSDPTPAYVVVSNWCPSAEAVSDRINFALSTAHNMKNFAVGDKIDIETYIQQMDDHEDITFLVECFQYANIIPVTFDGSLPYSLVSNDANGEIRKVGTKISAIKRSGGTIEGVLKDLSANGDVGIALFEGGEEYVFIELSAMEAEAASIFGDVVFGKAVGRRQDIARPSDAYRWAKSIFAELNRKQLLTQVPANESITDYERLQTEEIRTKLARSMGAAVLRSMMGDKNFRHIY